MKSDFKVLAKIEDETEYRNQYIKLAKETLIYYMNNGLIFSENSKYYYQYGIDIQDLHHLSYEDFQDHTSLVVYETKYFPEEVFTLDYDKVADILGISRYFLKDHKEIEVG